MITFTDIKEVVLPCVALRKNELHQLMLKTCTDEELISLKRCIDEYNKFERFLNNQIKSSDTEFLKQLNKV